MHSVNLEAPSLTIIGFLIYPHIIFLLLIRNINVLLPRASEGETDTDWLMEFDLKFSFDSKFSFLADMYFS